MLVFCAAPFVDELAGGVPTLGAPGMRSELALGFGAVAAVVLALPLLGGLLIETPLLLLSRHIGRRRVAATAFASFAAAAAGAACSTSAVWLAACLALGAAAGGVALALVETALMDAAPAQRERWMTRWTIGATLGDFAAPALLASAAWLGFGWRGAFVAAAVVTAVAGAAVVRRLPADRDARAAPPPPLRAAVRRALTCRPLLFWTFGAACCDLLDEILVVFGVLFLTDVHAVDAGVAALAFAALPAAAAAGLLLTEVMLQRVAPLRWLAVNCAVCGLGLAGLATAASFGVAVAMLFVVGCSAASLWPIATAQMYRSLRGDSITVAAVGQLFLPLHVALPLLVAAVAELAGLRAAVAVLALQPLVLLLLAWYGATAPRSR